MSSLLPTGSAVNTSTESTMPVTGNSHSPVSHSQPLTVSGRQAIIDAFDPHYPATAGGVFKYPSLQTHSFATSVALTVTRPTRVLAICGVTHLGEADSPLNDGWFISDYLLFNILLKSTAVAQTWICDAESTPDKLVARYANRYPPGYLHGDRGLPRKVVLDRKIAETRLTAMTGVHHRSLLPTFLRQLTYECDIARKNSQSVLTIILGHGIWTGHGIVLGVPDRQSRNPKARHDGVLTMEAFAEAVGEHVDITILTNACFSGGWAVSPLLNTTVLTAAGEQAYNFSESWPASASIGRYCGSMWATNLKNTLAGQVPQAMLSTGGSYKPVPHTDPKQYTPTYGAFTSEMYKNFFVELDRFAHTHEIRFSAQDDGWGLTWYERLGVPAHDFAQRYNELPTYEYKIPGPSGRSPHEIDDSTSSACGASGAAPADDAYVTSTGVSSALRRLLMYHTRDYLNSLPGADNAAPNTLVHGVVKRAAYQAESLAWWECEQAHGFIEYRSTKMHVSDRLLVMTGVGFPMIEDKLVRCAYFDADSYRVSKLSAGPVSMDCQRWKTILQLVMTAKLFPRPDQETQGPEWLKPEQFISAALTEAPLTFEEIEMRVSAMLAHSHQVLSGQGRTNA